MKTKKPKPDFYTKNDLNRDLMIWIAESLLPLSIVDTKIRTIIEKLGGEPLKHQRLVEKYLPNILTESQNNVLGIISKADYYSLTSDGWKSSNNKKIHWSSTTLHFIDEKWNLVSCLLDIGDLGESATADIITQLWETQLRSWSLNKEKLISCVVDGAANYQSAGRRFQVFNIWCNCHKLHLLSKDIIKLEQFNHTYKICKGIVQFANKSFVLNSRLRNEGITLNQASSTRWNSNYSMFFKFKEKKDGIVEVLKEFELDKDFDEEFWHQVNIFFIALKRISVTITSFESEKKPTINLVLNHLFSIKKSWNRSELSAELVEKLTSIFDERISLDCDEQ